MPIEDRTIQFLKSLSRNNNRDWFQRNRSAYDDALKNVSDWVEDLIREMSRTDQLQTHSARESLYRIYNDVRFTTDKTPYNPRFAGRLKRQKPLLRGGYYFWIKPGTSTVGCGFVHPNPEDLLRIRQDIDANHKEWRRLLRTSRIKSAFGEMQGDAVKIAPKGFDKEHPAIDLLRFKQFWFERSFSDSEVTSKGFLKQVTDTYKAIRPFFDHMSEVLTTDANGESLF